MLDPHSRSVEELFYRAVDLDPDQRQQFLDTQCGGDTELRAAVEVLLRHDAGSAPTASFLVSPVAQAVAAHASATLGADLPMPSIVGYEILGVLGSGGMGVVYKARQLSLRRLVALKMLLAGTPASTEYLARFRTEAEALARLQHPNIVQVFDQGEHEGRPYFAMEYVDGPSLAAVLDKGPLPPGASAQLIELLARAMHTVHQHGIVHRDLKPANILLSAECGARSAECQAGGAESGGQSAECQTTSAAGGGRTAREALRTPHSAFRAPKITDFGIAKLLRAQESQTQSGSILGTPWYMAPEQAEGGRMGIGAAADTYALGAILYELLTGRPPFQAMSLLETLDQVRTREPLALREFQPNVPRDLETICLKCLRKDPAKRYATAEALAEDLARFQRGLPILARPVGPVERAYRWCRRRPLVAALSAATILLALTLVISLLMYHARLRQALAQTEKTAEERRQLLVQVNVGSGMVELDDGNSLMGLLWFTEALRLDEGGPEHERNHRVRIGVTVRQVPRLVHLLASDQALSCVQASPDGRWVVTAGEKGMARLWDLATGEPGPELPHAEPVRHAAFSPDSRLLATVTAGGTARIWETATGKARTPSSPETLPVDQVVFHPGGQVLLTHRIDQRIRLREAATGEPIAFPELAEQAPAFSTLSADGRWVLTVDASHRGQVWDLNTGKPAWNLLALGQPVSQAAISENGRRVAVVAADGMARMWDAVSTKQLGEPLKHASPISHVAFSPEGDRVVTAADLTAKVWRADTGELVISGLRHDGVLQQAAFSPDGRLLMTSGSDNQTLVWDAVTGKPLTPPLRHNGSVFYAAFSRDRKHVMTAGRDDTVRVWELTGPIWTSTVAPEPLPDRTESRSSDGRWLISFGNGSAIQVKNAAGEPAGPLLRHGSLVTFACFSPDGARVVTASDDNTARIWNPYTGELLVPPLHHRGTVRWAEFSPDGSRVITAGDDHSARVWDVATGTQLTPPLKHPCGVRRASFAPEGERAITLGGDGVERTWDLTPYDGPVSALMLEAQVLSGHRLDAQRGLVPLEADHVRAVWESLKAGRSAPKPWRAGDSQ
jgi:serine/threonine protein kinase/WD40 repeat protein